MPPDKESRTEQATSKKRGKAREQGQVARSTEVDTVAMLFFGIIALYFISPWMLRRLMISASWFFREFPGIEISPGSIRQLSGNAIFLFLIITAPIVLIFALIGVTSNIAQIGFMWTTKPLKWKLQAIKPKFSKINIFSKNKLVDLGSTFGKLAIIGPIAALTIYKQRDQFIPLMDKTVYEILRFTSFTAFMIVLKVCAAMIFLAALDFAYRKWKHEDDIKMSKQEIKDERKDMEGDPKVKSQQRRAMLEFTYQRMMAAVPTADVVVTNPTHYAIAIKYDPEKMKAPKVVAKGARLVAQRIKELAKENRVPIVENKPLAQALYKSVKIGQMIPAQFYKAVAEVLAYIYRLNKKFTDRKRQI